MHNKKIIHFQKKKSVEVK